VNGVKRDPKGKKKGSTGEKREESSVTPLVRALVCRGYSICPKGKFDDRATPLGGGFPKHCGARQREKNKLPWGSGQRWADGGRVTAWGKSLMPVLSLQKENGKGKGKLMRLKDGSIGAAQVFKRELTTASGRLIVPFLDL